MEGRFFLVDGTALAYRSHFAFIHSPLTTSTGRQISAAFGYVTAILRILEQEEPEFMAVAFDRKEPTFRKKRYPEYKATREKAPEEMLEQFPVIKRMTEALGIPVLEMAGYEADDLIGTAAVHAQKEGLEVLIVSGDKDMMQLVNDRTKIYDISKPRAEPYVFGADGVEKKFGVPPDKVTDVLGLMGDSSDNVPGVPLVGPKKARALVQEWGSLEEVLAHASEGKPNKTKKNLIEFADQARLSKELVTIDLEVPIALSLERLHPSARDHAALVELFTELEFTQLLKDVQQNTAKESARSGYRIIERADLDALIDELSDSGLFAFDTETTSLDPYSAELVGFSFSHRSGEAVYVPCYGDASIVARLKPLLENEAVAKAGQNMKYDVQVLKSHGVDVANLSFDTMVASYLLDPGRGIHNLDSLALRHLGILKTPTAELIGKGKDEITMAQVPVEKVAMYAAEDADCTYRLVEFFIPRLQEEGLTELFQDVEMPLVPVLVDMERAGVKIDSEYLGKISVELEETGARLTKEIHAIAGEEFNINSPKQLGPILFEKLGIQKGSRKRPRKTKTGFSTDARTLENYASHPIVEKLLEYREAAKLRSTYVDALPRLVHPMDGRIHSSFNQTVAATGRLSSADPNLQNIPVRTEMGRRIRAAFIAEKGCRLLCADYNQIELRLMAHLSGDPALCDVYLRGGDIHAETASRMFGCELEEVTREQRGSAKAINFGILYGMGPQRLGQDLKITMQDAREFLDAYFREFPGVKEFQRAAVARARTQGYVTTLLGRKRAIPEILSDLPGVRANAENMAMNTPLQGTAADLIKVAMIRIHARMAEQGFRAKMILQVHDELVFETPEAECDSLATMVKQEMENALELSIPVVVDIGMGKNWLEAH